MAWSREESKMIINLRHVSKGDRVQKLLERGGVVGVDAPEDGVVVHVGYGRRIYIPYSKIDDVFEEKGTLSFEQLDEEK